MPTHGSEIERILPPVDRRLIGTSAWINDLTEVEVGDNPGWPRSLP